MNNARISGMKNKYYDKVEGKPLWYYKFDDCNFDRDVKAKALNSETRQSAQISLNKGEKCRVICVRSAYIIFFWNSTNRFY